MSFWLSLSILLRVMPDSLQRLSSIILPMALMEPDAPMAVSQPSLLSLLRCGLNIWRQCAMAAFILSSVISPLEKKA